MKDLLVQIGRNVAAFRAKCDLTQVEAANRARWHKTMWGKVEKGLSNFSLSTLMIVAHVVGCEVWELLAPHADLTKKRTPGEPLSRKDKRVLAPPGPPRRKRTRPVPTPPDGTPDAPSAGRA